MMTGYLDTEKKERCFGCEACVQICPNKAIEMILDDEGFYYPKIDSNNCVHCNLCRKVCEYENPPIRYNEKKYVFGGYIKDAKTRDSSTSGGAFSAIAYTFCDENYVIFGAEAKGLSVFHSYITDISEINKFRKSKYSQSKIGTSFLDCKRFLKEGKKVLFSGTPCQIAGLRTFLGAEFRNLLTVEVICEGVPSPLYMKKYNTYLMKKYGSSIESVDYRYTDSNTSENPISGKWDFQVMYTELKNGKKMKRDRWFNPFWSIWLNHLISRPSCYECPYTTIARCADVSLGDLWGIHLYCPELYGKNLGASLIVCNNEKGKLIVKNTETLLYGHELDFNRALKYQSPMRQPISKNPDREKCMDDLRNNDIDFEFINKKWAKKPTIKLLWQKYIWGNRQKIALWNIIHKESR